MVDRFERFTLAISEINRYWHRLTTQEMEPYGLKGAHCMYLLALARHPEGITAPRLCEACDKDKADVSRTMALLEQKGMAVREGTHYRALYRLTEPGMAAAEHVKKRAALAVEIAGSDLTDGDRAVFYDALESITARLQKLNEEGLPEA